VGFQLSAPIIPLLAAAGIAAVLFGLTVVQRGRTGVLPMSGFLGAIVIWTVSYGLMLGTTEPQVRMIWLNLRFLGPTAATLSIFVFALQYTGRERYVTTRNIALLAVVPLVTNALVWTNFAGLMFDHVRVVAPAGELVRLDVAYGPWFWVHTAYSYLLGMSAVTLFLEKWLRIGQTESEERLTRNLLLATVIPFSGNAIHLLGLYPLDLAPFGFVVSGVFILAAIAWYS
jgi:hypothetical protein